ncbi:hypothetical protein DFH09DRAFT_1113250, partial [Mycena vulgaris]
MDNLLLGDPPRYSIEFGSLVPLAALVPLLPPAHSPAMQNPDGQRRHVASPRPCPLPPQPALVFDTRSTPAAAASSAFTAVAEQCCHAAGSRPLPPPPALAFGTRSTAAAPTGSMPVAVAENDHPTPHPWAPADSVTHLTPAAALPSAPAAPPAAVAENNCPAPRPWAPADSVTRLAPAAVVLSTPAAPPEDGSFDEAYFREHAHAIVKDVGGVRAILRREKRMRTGKHGNQCEDFAARRQQCLHPPRARLPRHHRPRPRRAPYLPSSLLLLLLSLPLPLPPAQEWVQGMFSLRTGRNTRAESDFRTQALLPAPAPCPPIPSLPPAPSVPTSVLPPPPPLPLPLHCAWEAHGEQAHAHAETPVRDILPACRQERPYRHRCLRPPRPRPRRRALAVPIPTSVLPPPPPSLPLPLPCAWKLGEQAHMQAETPARQKVSGRRQNARPEIPTRGKGAGTGRNSHTRAGTGRTGRMRHGQKFLRRKGRARPEIVASRHSQKFLRIKKVVGELRIRKGVGPGISGCEKGRQKFLRNRKSASAGRNARLHIKKRARAQGTKKHVREMVEGRNTCGKWCAWGHAEMCANSEGTQKRVHEMGQAETRAQPATTVRSQAEMPFKALLLSLLGACYLTALFTPRAMVSMEGPLPGFCKGYTPYGLFAASGPWLHCMSQDPDITHQKEQLVEILQAAWVIGNDMSDPKSLAAVFVQRILALATVPTLNAPNPGVDFINSNLLQAFLKVLGVHGNPQINVKGIQDALWD